MSEEAGKAQRAEDQVSGVLRQLHSAQSLIAALNEDLRVLTEERSALKDQVQLYSLADKSVNDHCF